MDSSNSLLIFLVDDDAVFLKSLEYHLQHRLKYTYRIKSFHAGEECLEVLNQKPDIVILDYMLGGNNPYALNGVHILKKIKEMSPATEVIMLSGYEKTEVAIESVKNGAYDYVVKNESVLVKLQSVLKNVINQIKARRQLKTYRVVVASFVLLVIAILITIILK